MAVPSPSQTTKPLQIPQASLKKCKADIKNATCLPKRTLTYKIGTKPTISKYSLFVGTLQAPWKADGKCTSSFHFFKNQTILFGWKDMSLRC